VAAIAFHYAGPDKPILVRATTDRHNAYALTSVACVHALQQSLHLFSLVLDGPVPGAAMAVRTLRDHGKRVRFLTNDASTSRADRAAELRQCGVDAADSEVFTACARTASYVRQHGTRPTQLLVSGSGRQDFSDLPIVEEHAEVVVVGDFFAGYSHRALDAAYTALCEGAEFIAVQRNSSCWRGGAVRIDCGFWVAGLEFCTGRTAHVVGKPARDAYLTVLSDAGCAPRRAVMVSDDADSDLHGARAAQLHTVHVPRATESASSGEDQEVPDVLHFVQSLQ